MRVVSYCRFGQKDLHIGRRIRTALRFTQQYGLTP
jgi:hypothetical protein